MKAVSILQRTSFKRISPVQLFSRSFSKKKEVSIELKNPFELHLLEDGPSNTVKASASDMMDYYRQLVTCRRLETTADTLYKKQFIKGFCHLYDGQEAIAVGMEAGLTKNDSIITAYREHCQQLMRGDTPHRIFAELMGKKTGCSLGKGGSMHMYLPEKNFYGGNGIVGAQVPLGAGIAFAHHYKNDGGVCFAMYGDGAANQGQIYEAANMAMLWKLPFIMVIENNHYGMGTSAERAASNTKYYTRGGSIPGLLVDGMDVLAVKEGTEFAKKFALENGPIFVEMNTYRYHGHSMTDPGTSYRTRDEVAMMRSERDCIERCKKHILDQGWATTDELKAIDKEVRKEIDEAAEKAKKDPQPDLSEAFTHITIEPEPFIRHREYSQSIGNVNL